ncbi:MAG TPA: A/G-specific adenine glycosylase [Smithellaceae bacterium]|nr:A/G-specific adenine glycosylase [Smithellaceae bacterium]
MMKYAAKIKNPLRRKLLAWYRHHQRSLPWRNTNDPYCIWISEIMLQQTRVDTVIPYYERFIKSFPDVRTLANAPVQDVLKIWENLGYYSRARNIHAASRIITDRCGGRIPDKSEEIKTLPGIGDYTAGAILSIAYGLAVPAVDGNVRRILSRVFAIRKSMDDPRGQKKLLDLAAALVPSRHAGDFNQALMDLGATICRVKKPDCLICPVGSICRARLSGLQESIPVTRKNPAIPRKQGAAAVIFDASHRLLIVQRPSSGLLASLWKLPGGFVHDGKSIKKCLRDCVREELNISIAVGSCLASADHTYTHFRLTLQAFDCRLMKGNPEARTCQNWRWATTSQLEKLPMSKIDRKILAEVASSSPLS